MSFSSETSSLNGDWENLDTAEKLQRELEEQREQLLRYQKENANLHKEIQRLKENEREKNAASNEPKKSASEGQDISHPAIQRKWMQLAIHDLLTANIEIEEITHKLFKSFAQQEAVALRTSLPCYIEKTLKQLRVLEKECRNYMDGVTKWSKKQLSSAKAIIAKTAKRMPKIADINDKEHLPELSKEAIEVADSRLQCFNYNDNDTYKEYIEKSIVPYYGQIEKIGNDGFYKETLKFKDGGSIVCQWRPDNVLRDGIRAVLEGERLNIYCVSRRLLRYYLKDSGSYYNYR